LKEETSNTLALNLRKKPVTRCIFNIALYGAGICTLRKEDHKYLEGMKCDAADGWRSVGLIVVKKNKYYTK
jgi:hypothetical protein